MIDEYQTRGARNLLEAFRFLLKAIFRVIKIHSAMAVKRGYSFCRVETYITTSSMLSAVIFDAMSSIPSASIDPRASVTRMILRIYLSFLVNLVIIWMATTIAEMAGKFQLHTSESR